MRTGRRTPHSGTRPTGVLRPGRPERTGPLVLALAACLTAAACGTVPGAGPTPTTPAEPRPPSSAVSASAAPVSPSALASPTPARPSTPEPGTPRPTATPTPATVRCADLARSLSLRNQVGQLLMVAVSSGGVSSGAANAIDDSRAGSVLLLGNTTAGVDRVASVIDRARRAARTPGDIETLVAADQEGGQVQRLQGKGFDRIPSAQRQAQDPPAELESDAARWGRQLKRAGVDADLAPVADVVPKNLQNRNQPVGVLRRGYGSDPSAVASHVSAFVRGMDDAGMATSLKHFPGLGRVLGNTDVTSQVVDDTTTRRDPSLKPFAAGIDAGTDMVMVSSAFYPRIDRSRRAAFSPAVITGMLRGDLGFTGVVISDDLAAVAMQDVSPGQRMLRFVRAGGDLAIVGDPALAARMADALVDEAGDDPELAAAVEASTRRVLQLKDRRGLADC
ncbi:glycoside hydrolase family 3 N-terminal domain-containing protein [Microlunatus aurantiacus]|uniref:beta-N-acetylhexosaminidase n=1 Tax=Microlunatus aurantiacus TaxID=446786 RepID=A0ABP7EDZ3_9ACTN